MEGMLKEEKLEIAPEIETIKYEDVPIDIYKFFNQDLVSTNPRELDQLKDISKWTFKDASTLDDGLRKLRNLEIKLGMPGGSETRKDKLWNWIAYNNRQSSSEETI